MCVYVWRDNFSMCDDVNNKSVLHNEIELSFD